MEENIQLHTLMGELCLHSWTLVWCQTMGGNLAMSIFMSRFPPILWHKHATTKSGDPIVQHSYAMNTHACSIPFCNCMFVLDKGWNSGYIHGLLYGARQGVELWLYSCIVGWTHWQVKYAWLYYSETPLNGHPSTADTHDTAKVPTVLPFASILNQPLNIRHPIAPYNRQFLWFQLFTNNTYLMTLT